ncbi:MAG: hypothetical protein AB8G05_19645 [Oligoflexales bacterium]
MPSKSTLNLLIACPLAFQASTMLGEMKTGGDVEINIDSTSLKTESPDKTIPGLPIGGDGSFFLMSNYKEGSLYAEGKIGGYASLDGNVGTEDVYVKIGSDAWDVTAGYFEAADLYGWGQDTIISSVNGIFAPNEARGRAAGAVMGQYHVGGAATLQLNIVAASDSVDETVGEATTTHGLQVTGIRPVAIITPMKALAVTLGAEMITKKPSDNVVKWERAHNNVGGNIKYMAEMFDAGVSFGSQTVSGKTFADTDIDETSQTSFGLYGTFKIKSAGDVGVGYFMSTAKDGMETGETTMTDTAGYLAYNMAVGKQTWVKLGLSQGSAKAEVDGSDASSTVTKTTFRLRLAHNL